MINVDDLLEDVARALKEDLGTGDVSAQLIAANQQVTAQIIAREPLLMCGQAWANAVFTVVSPAIEINWFVQEGEWLEEPTTLCQIAGPARAILTAERSVLNFLQTLSGTATRTYHYLQAMGTSDVRLLDTRKTLPGLRKAQKYAVVCAGGMNHRIGLYDAFLIKENHIKACGSIKSAISKARSLQYGILVEVEVENLYEYQQARAAKPDRILLDNFSESMLREAVDLNVPKVCELEASGGVTLFNIAAIATTGIDYISVGDLTKSVQAIDLSLLIQDEE